MDFLERRQTRPHERLHLDSVTPNSSTPVSPIRALRWPQTNSSTPTTATTPTFDLGDLPVERVVIIARYLDTSTVYSLARTCQCPHKVLRGVLEKCKLSSKFITAVHQSKRLLATGLDPNTHTKAGSPVLHGAARSTSVGHMPARQTLLDCYWSRGAIQTQGTKMVIQHYIQLLSGIRNDTSVRWLLKYADPNATNTEMQWTPLHHATYVYNLRIVNLLRANNANPNVRDATGGTALHVVKQYRYGHHRDTTFCHSASYVSALKILYPHLESTNRPRIFWEVSIR